MDSRQVRTEQGQNQIGAAGLAKWRRKTVDFVDDLALGAAEALSASTAKKAAEAAEQKEAKKEEKSVVNSGPIVIAPKAEVEVKTPAETGKVTVIPATPLTPATPATSGTVPGYKEVAPDQLPANAIQMGAGKLVLVIGSDAFNMTMMTANAGGSLGKSSRQACYFQLPFSRPALRTDGDGRNLHRSFLSGKPNRTVSCFGM